MRQASILHRASSKDINQFSFRHSCRNLPLKDSTVALSVGVPGREKSIQTVVRYRLFEAQRQTLLTVEAVDSFVIIAPAFPPEHHVYPAVPVMNPGFGYLTDA